jgi:hypothetical protein
MGIGDSSEYVGLEASVGILDASHFKNGNVSLKLHRMLPEGFGVSVGRESVVKWGEVDSRDQAWYGAVSKVFFLRDETELFSAIYLTAGLGDGRFRSEADRDADKKTINVFGSFGVRVVQPVSLIADWTGQDLNVGASITPFRTLPIYINPTLADVSRRAGDGVRFLLGVAYVASFT